MARRTAFDDTLDVWRETAENIRAVERMHERARRSSENAMVAVKAAIANGENSPEHLDEVFREARDSTIIAAMEELPARALGGREFEMLPVVEAGEFLDAKPGLYRVRMGATGAWLLLRVFSQGGFVLYRALYGGAPLRH